MRVLITGGTGFIGHHLVEHILKNTDWEIVILDRLDTSGNLNRISDISIYNKEKKRIKFVWHDLKAEINNLVAHFIGEIDYVYHLAAGSHVDRSLENPLEFVMDNVVGTCNMLNFSRQLDNLRKFINFSTDEVFGPAPDNYSHKEEDPFRPSNPYAATKAGSVCLGFAFFKSYGLPVINTMTMNNYGQRQHPEKLIPKTICSILKDVPMTIHCKLNEKEKPIEIGSRKWIHCRNTADALLFITEHGDPGEAYNIIGKEEINNLDMAKMIADILDMTLKVEYVDFHKTRPGHDRRYSLDGGKLEKMGWKPPVDFKESLKETVLWSVKNRHWLGL